MKPAMVDNIVHTTGTASRSFLSELGDAYVSIEKNILKHGRAGLFAPIESKASSKGYHLLESPPPAYTPLPPIFNPRSKIARGAAIAADLAFTPVAAVSYLPMYGAYKLARAAGVSKEGANKAAGITAVVTLAGLVGAEAKLITDESNRK